MFALAQYFQLEERGTTAAREARGAVATFLTMAYILFANPAILAAAGIPQEPALACTALAAGICCLLMGFGANMPIALASGMGLNAVVAFQITKAAGTWQQAMGVVVIDGLVILLLVLAGFRERVLDAIPPDLRRAIGGGIGLFIAFIGLVNGHLVVAGAAGGPPVSFGSFRDPAAIVCAVGLLVTAALLVRRVPGAFVVGILAGTVLALLLRVAKLPTGGVLQPPSFSLAFQADILGALRPALLPALLSLVVVDFFDTLGTATAIGEQAGLTDGRGRVRNLRSLLVVDSLSASIGGLLGASSVTAYIESAAGVAEGARTGLHTVIVGLLFLAATFLAPLAGVVPGAATAPALILVGFLMLEQIAQINFRDLETGIPAFVTLVTIPLTYSISHGLGYGFLLYVAMKALAGKLAEVPPALFVVAAAFAAYFIFGG